MDEGLLNDLLECSVCFERLDTSSRVLPCQHTFCLKCLKEIVKSHKELRCPECRVLIETRVEDLPPNVLLMRILESMKNNSDLKRITKEQQSSNASGLRQSRIAQMHHQTMVQHNQRTNATEHSSKVHQAAIQPIPHALAVYDYLSKEAGDLPFKKGEVILLRRKVDSHWYQGECGGKAGVFPVSYVQVLVPLPSVVPQCKALYDFRMSAPDEEGCLAFDKGAVITVIRRVDENWAEGKLNDRIGIFPIAFVEMNLPARALIKMSAQGRVVPATPADSNPAAPRQYPVHQQAQIGHCYQQMTQSSPMTGAMHPSNQPMSQSHPSYNHGPLQQASEQQVASQVSIAPAVNAHRIHLDMKQPMTDLIQLTQMTPVSIATVTGQGLNMLIGEPQDSRMRISNSKFATQHYQTLESTISGIKPPPQYPGIVSFNNSTDSSSTNTTPSVGVSSVTTTPNSSSNTSSASDSTEPSSPTSPANRTDDSTPLVRLATEQNTNREGNASNSSPVRLQEPISQNPDALSPVAAHEPSENIRSANSPTKQQQPTFQSYIQDENFYVPKNLNLPSTSKPYVAQTSNGAVKDQASEQNFTGTPRNLHLHHRQKEKRHSLTPGNNQSQGLNSQHNRHSAEILATSLLDLPNPESQSKHDSSRGRQEEKAKSRRRSRSNEDPLPTPYIALYPYKPQKKDELELKKGGIYTVLERCQDGWYKGISNRSSKCGVFPGNYVITARQAQAMAAQAKLVQNQSSTSASARKADTKLQSSHDGQQSQPAERPNPYRDIPTSAPPPDLPPRSQSPTPVANSSSHAAFVWNVPSQGGLPPTQIIQTVRSDKSKENKPLKLEKPSSSMSTGVSLMKRLAAMKKCKSPPPVGYSMDNPVFEDSGGENSSMGSAQNAPTASHHPVHVRSSNDSSGSHTILAQHRKSQSLDAGSTSASVNQSRTKQSAPNGSPQTQHVKEKFRCVVPYPANSVFELELRVGDIVLVSRKRGDGWYKGTHQRSGRVGLFPASFVDPCAD